MFSGSAERDQCHGICSCIAEWPSYLFFGQIVIQQRDEKTFWPNLLIILGLGVKALILIFNFAFSHKFSIFVINMEKAEFKLFQH